MYHFNSSSRTLVIVTNNNIQPTIKYQNMIDREIFIQPNINHTLIQNCLLKANAVTTSSWVGNNKDTFILHSKWATFGLEEGINPKSSTVPSKPMPHLKCVGTINSINWMIKPWCPTVGWFFEWLKALKPKITQIISPGQRFTNQKWQMRCLGDQAKTNPNQTWLANTSVRISIKMIDWLASQYASISRINQSTRVQRRHKCLSDRIIDCHDGNEEYNKLTRQVSQFITSKRM